MSSFDENREWLRETEDRKLLASLKVNIFKLWKLLASLFLVLCLSSTAIAADVFCGVDTDQSGTASNACPAPDADGDGYPSSSAYNGPYGAGLVDCDDTDSFLYPGIETTSGCSAGQYRTCGNDGTYSACADISTFTCHTGSGATYWFAHDAADCTSYTYNSPANWLCFSNTGATNYHAPVAGDCFVFKGGSYTGSWSAGARQIYVSNKDGTAQNRIVMRMAPGVRVGVTPPTLNGTSSSPTEVEIVKIEDSDYWTIKGFSLDGTSDYSGSGIHIAGGASPIMDGLRIRKIDGESDNNAACIKVRGAASNSSMTHILLEDCYEVGDATNQNSGGITVMDDPGAITIWHVWIANSTPVGHGIWIKHASDTATPSIKYNFIRNVSRSAIGSENKDNTITNNWIKDCVAYAFEYGGIGTTGGWFKDSVFSYNTLESCALLDAKPRWTDSLSHQSFSGTTIFTAAYNIMADDNASYDGDAGDGVTRLCDSGCTSGERAASAGKAIWANNDYYSSGTSTFRFSAFGSAGGGSYYGSLAAWQAAGFDSGSVQADPGLDADGISATYPNHGWRAGIFTDASPPSTGGTSSGIGSIFNLLFRRR